MSAMMPDAPAADALFAQSPLMQAIQNGTYQTMTQAQQQALTQQQDAWGVQNNPTINADQTAWQKAGMPGLPQGSPAATLGNAAPSAAASFQPEAWTDPNSGQQVMINPDTGQIIGSADGSPVSSPTPGGGGATASAPAPAGPSLADSMFGNPAGAQPLPFSAFGPTPQISPSFAAPGLVDRSQLGTPTGASFSNPSSVDMSAENGLIDKYEQAVQQSLNPTFQAQRDTLDQQLASRGIFNSSAGQDQASQLQESQNATLAGAYAPIIQTGMTGGQAALSQNSAQAQAAASQTSAQQQAANLLGYTTQAGALEGNANNVQSTNQFNATGANQASAGNAATQLGITQGDQSSYNAFEQALLGYGAQMGNTELSALLGSYNPTATSILGNGVAPASAASTGAGAAYNGSGLASGLSNIFSNLNLGGKRNTGAPVNGYGSTDIGTMADI